MHDEPKAKFKIKGAPDGYRRVSNGYTRPGDLAYDDVTGLWVPVPDTTDLVSDYIAIARPRKVEKTP